MSPRSPSVPGADATRLQPLEQSTINTTIVCRECLTLRAAGEGSAEGGMCRTDSLCTTSSIGAPLCPLSTTSLYVVSSGLPQAIILCAATLQIIHGTTLLVR